MRSVQAIGVPPFKFGRRRAPARARPARPVAPPERPIGVFYAALVKKVIDDWWDWMRGK